MPQQQPTRAFLRTSTRARRTPRFHAITTGVVAVAAAALAATTAVPANPAGQSAVRSTATPGAKAVTVSASDASGAEVAPITASPEVVAAVEAAVAQASGALATAEHVTTEGSGTPADQIAQIQQTTSVVRELVRRVSTTDEPAVAAPSTPATAAPAATTPATEPAADTTDAATTDLTAGETTHAAPAAQEIGAAADAAVAAAGATSAADAEPHVVATALTQQTAVLTQLIDANPSAAVAVVPGPSPEEIAALQAAEQQAAAEAEAAHLAALAAEAMQYGNGQIPEHLLSPIPWSTTGSKLRADAAAALIRLNEAFRAAFGTDLGITDSYRSYADQVAVKQLRGRWAAVPGYSNHGFGVAVDLGTGIADFSSPQYAWMKANAPAYGWIHPDWAEPGGSKPEAWHWEFAG